MQGFNPCKRDAETRRYQTGSEADADQVISQRLNNRDGLGLLDRSLVFGNQDSLFRFDEDTPVSLISPVPVGVK